MPPVTSWAGTADIKGSTESIRMALLTASLVGIQFTWGIEMTYCTPYLLRLGLTKSKVSLVWVAGPLSGLIMQPIVGIIADRSTSRFGRRRPFMAVGTALVVLCLALLGWTVEAVRALGIRESNKKEASIALAVLSIYGIDFAINAVQASARSLIVDTLPAAKQQLGSAWATRNVAVGSLVGYAFGALDLGSLFGNHIGDTQFKRLIVVAAVFLTGCVGLTCWAVDERVLVTSGKDAEHDNAGVLDMLNQILSTAMHLPRRIAVICRIQFWSWIGWFPFLFYTTTFIGEVFLRYNAPPDVRAHPDALGQVGRVGSMSLVVFSIITFASSVVIPWLVKAPAQDSAEFTPRPPASIAGVLAEPHRFKPSLVTVWAYSHLVFAGAMMLAPFVTSYCAATAIVAVCGIPWAVACWAPFTFMGMEISRLGGEAAAPSAAKTRHSGEHDEKDRSLFADGPHSDSCSSGPNQLAGVYLGILNLYTTLPQFIGTFISWAVFSVLEPGKSPELATEAHPDEHHSTDGPNGVAVCLFIGALAALVAARDTHKLRRMG